MCEDIKHADYRELLRKFGRQGESLWKRSHGIDERDVVVERERKSVGVERTFSQNISSYEECWQVIEEKLFPELEVRLAKASPDKAIIKQGIKVKFADFQLTTIEHIYPQLELDDFRQLLRDVLKRQNGREIRLLGLNVMLKPELQSATVKLLLMFRAILCALFSHTHCPWKNSKLCDAILLALEEKLSIARSSTQRAIDAATDEETIPEHKYDTLALEASYLAHGQALRVQESESGA